MYVPKRRDGLERERICFLGKDGLRSGVVNCTPLLYKYCWDSIMEVLVGASMLHNQRRAGVYATGENEISGVSKGYQVMHHESIYSNIHPFLISGPVLLL